MKEKNLQYKEFCKENNRTIRADRTQVFGYNRSVSGKATAAAKRAEAPKLRNAAGHPVTPVKHTALTAAPNSITQYTTQRGNKDRNYYDAEGKQYKQISNYDHGNAKLHPNSTEQGHAHDYIYDVSGNLISRPMRALTQEEREENRDIL